MQPTSSSPAPTLISSLPQHLLQEQLIQMGAHAPIEEILLAFECGNLGAFARQEVPLVCAEYHVTTIGEFAKLTREQMIGPRCRLAGNKTIAWIEGVFREFGQTLRYSLRRRASDYTYGTS